MSDPRTNEVSLREYLEEKIAHAEDRLQGLEQQIEIRDRQRLEDKGANEVRLREHQASHDREHATATLNAEKDEKKLDNRLSTMNEIRAQLDTQASTFARIDYVEARFQSLMERMELADKNNESRREQGDSALSERVSKIEKDIVLMAGRSGGSATTIAYIFSAVGVVAALIGIFTFLAGQ